MAEWIRRTTGVLLVASGVALILMRVRQLPNGLSSQSPAAVWGTAAAAVAAGAWAVAGAHRDRPGIRTTAPWVVWLWDVLFLCAAVPVAFLAIDGMVWRLTGIESGIDGALQFVGVLGVALGAPILALALTLMGGQSVEVTGTAVRTHSAFGGEETPWGEVTGFAVGEQSIVTVKVGAPVRRRLQRPLMIRAGARSLSINEPPLADSKAEIAAALVAHAPERLHSQLESNLADW